MKALEDLRRRLTNVGDIKSVVATMKSLAAVNIRQYERAADATDRFARTIELALQILMRSRPAKTAGGAATKNVRNDEGGTGIIVFGSDQGLCGALNDDVASAVQVFLNSEEITADPVILTVGSRVDARIRESGLAVAATHRVPPAVSDITTVVQDLMPQIETWQNLQNVGRIDLFFSRRTTSSSCEPARQLLLPLSARWLSDLGKRPWASRSLPTHQLPWQQLFAAVIRQYLFLQLFRACAESRASENASRIASMQRAEKNIDERLSELRTEFNQHRQQSITEELLDIMTGFDVVTVE